MGAFWKQLFKAQGTTLSMSSSYHPQSDGQTENHNKTIEMYLRCFSYANLKKWVSFLPWAQLWYNTSFHHSLGMTPSQAVFGRLPPSIIRYKLQPSDPLSLQENLKAWDQLLTQLRHHLFKSQNYMKQQADKHRRDVQLQVGDFALVKLQPYRQHSVALHK